MRARLLTVVAALALIAIVGSAAAAELLRDDFESGNLGNWVVQTGGDGSAVVQSTVVQSGARAARLAASSNAGSLATIKKTFSASQTEFEVEADVRLLAQGANGGNVPVFKLYDAAGTRLVNLFRQNTASGRLYAQHSGAYNVTNGFLPMDAWRNLRLRVVVVSDGLSTVEVKLDGATIYQTNSASLGTQGVRTLQLGNEVKAQRFDIAIDDVVATNPSTDTDPPETTIDSGPSGEVASTTASFMFSSDEDGSFECKLDSGAWSACSSPKDYTGLSDGAHTFNVRAIDEAGNVDATPAVRTWTVALGDGCDAGAPPPTNGDPGTVVVADNFESGDFRNWTVRQQGDAIVRIQSEEVRSGRCAAELDVSNVSWDSRANLIRTLPARTNEVWADGWFNVRTDGESADWNDATFRFLAEGKRILDVSRQNQNGALFVRYPNPAGGWSVISLNRTIALDRWYRYKIHAVANGNLSTVQVWLDGTKVYDTNAATFGVSELDVAMVGAEHQNQEGEVATDDVVVKALSPAPTDVVFSDGFESGNFAAWSSTATGGDGTVAVQSDTVRSGARAARFTATANAGSFSNVKKTLADNETDLTASAHVRVAAEGAAGGIAQLLTFNDAGGSRLVTVYRNNQSGGRLALQYGGGTFTTTGTLPLDQWATLTLQTITRGPGASTVRVLLDGAQIYSSNTATLAATGVKTIMLGATSASKGYTFLADDVTARRGTAGPAPDPRYKLLIADYLNRRLLITDFAGRVVWQFQNPTGNASYTAGPIGVKWLPNNKILATFGTGEVGVIDVATKTWDWQTKGFGGVAFSSPYDAELLPDGRLAVALRLNDGGRVTVYDRSTGLVVWNHNLSNAHSVSYRTAAQSFNSDQPTLLIGGWGAVKEVTYGGVNPTVSWQVTSEFTHDALVLDDDTVLTNEGYYIRKINRAGTQLWRRSTPDENRRVAVNPNAGGGFVYTVGEGDRIEFRDANGFLLRDWARLSDDTVLDYPYGVQVIEFPG